MGSQLARTEPKPRDGVGIGTDFRLCAALNFRRWIDLSPDDPRVSEIYRIEALRGYVNEVCSSSCPSRRITCAGEKKLISTLNPLIFPPDFIANENPTFWPIVRSLILTNKFNGKVAAYRTVPHEK